LGREKKKRTEKFGGELTSREVFDYFRGASIVKNHTLSNIIAQHCLSIDFINKVESIEAEVSQGKFSLFLSKLIFF